MKLIFFTVLIGMCMFFFILSIVCVCFFVLFFLLNGFLEHSDSFCLSLSPHTEPFHFFVMLLKVFISFLSMSMVYLKLPFEYQRCLCISSDRYCGNLKQRDFQ